MALSLDVETESVRTATTDPWTWSHTAGANAKAGVVFAGHGTESTDLITGEVTWGGVPMRRVVTAADTANEPGRAYLYFLGAGFLTGLQTISADLASATTTDIEFVSWSINARNDCEVIDFDSISENAANPTVTLQKQGREGYCLCGMYGGGAAPGGTLAAGNTAGPSEDQTAFYSQTCRETTIDSDAHTIGWSTLGTDDLAFVALALAEKIPRHPGINHQNPALLMQGWRRGLSGLWRRPEIWLPEGALAA